jgi:hypothetical protein
MKRKKPKRRLRRRDKGPDATRAFKIDGERLYLRRAKCNKAFLERVADKIRSGEYKHHETTDDVEVYEIAEWSPMRRKQVDITEMTNGQIEQAIIQSACARDFKLYYDACAELAYRYKGGDLPEGTAKMIFTNVMQYLELRIMRRGGPSPFEIENELRAIRKQRTGTRIYLPH